jgi:YbbR domain-containing protein
MDIAGFRHVGLKMLSIAMASLLWVLVAGEQIVERSIRVPLEFTNVPSQLEIIGDPPSVDVRVRGSSGSLGRMATGDLVAVLDLSEARPGQRLFHLTSAQVRTPFGVEVVQVSPSSLSMRFESSVSKVVPVVPNFEGEPADGFVVGTITSDPSTVELVGALSTLSGITEAITEPVSVAGASASFTDVVAVGSPDPSVRLRNPQSARVSISITAAPVEWRVAEVPVQIRNAGRATEVAPKHVTVYARGPRDSVVAEADDFDAYVDVQGVRGGTFSLPVRVIPPTRVGVIRVEPPDVVVTVR